MKVLIIRTSAIGDCVMATWAVSALRREAPDAQIDWLVEERCAPTIEVERLVNRRIALPRKTGDGRKRRGTVVAQLRTCARLARERYDVGLDLQGHAKTALALRLARPRARFLARAQDAFAAEMGTVLPLLREHEVDVAADALARATDLGCVARVDRFPIAPAIPARERRLAIVAVSAGRPDRALAPSAITEVAKGLAQRGLRVELIGGPGDRRPEDLGGAKDRVGRLSLSETMARIGQADLVVAGDTGAGHIAAAYGTPVVSVFGPNPSARYRPYTALGEILEGGNRADSIHGEAILAACDQLLIKV